MLGFMKKRDINNKSKNKIITSWVKQINLIWKWRPKIKKNCAKVDWKGLGQTND